MNTKKIIFGILGLFLLVNGLFYLMGSFYFSKTTIFKEYWNIEFPNNYKIEYEVNKTSSIQGDGVILCKVNTNDDFIFIENGNKGNNNELESKINVILKEEGIENYYFPDFKMDYSWEVIEKEENSLYLLSFKKINSIYLISQIF